MNSKKSMEIGMIKLLMIQKSKMYMNKLIFSLIILMSFMRCSNKAEDSVRLIPSGYTGPVLIIFNQSNGEKKEYEDGKRIYRIPKSGVLRTQFEPNYGITRHDFFYVDSTGNRIKIPFKVVQNDTTLIEDTGKIYAFGERAPSEGQGYDSKHGRYVTPATRCFYVGEFKNIEETYRKVNKFRNNHMSSSRVYID